MPSGGLSADASQGDALLPAQFFLLARRREPVTVTVTRAWRSSLLAPSVLSYPIPQHRVSGQRMVVTGDEAQRLIASGDRWLLAPGRV